jgi:hypothetical protein
MVSDDMLRMDEVGDDSDDGMQGYLLFDRKQRIVLSVDPETRSVMIIGQSADEAVPESPVALEIESRPLKDAPLFAGPPPGSTPFIVRDNSVSALSALRVKFLPWPRYARCTACWPSDTGVFSGLLPMRRSKTASFWLMHTGLVSSTAWV